MYGLPLPASPVVVFVPDWLVCGQRSPRTQPAGVAKTVMSRPISAFLVPCHRGNRRHDHSGGDTGPGLKLFVQKLFQLYIIGIVALHCGNQVLKLFSFARGLDATMGHFEYCTGHI